MRDVGDVGALVEESDVVFSIMRPASAKSAADAVAAALAGTGRSLLYADCNAVLPSTARSMHASVTDAGGRFADVAIQGPPPAEPGLLIYASGDAAPQLAELRPYGLDVQVLDGPAGQASSIDLIVGGTVKLFDAVALQLLVAARACGLEAVLARRSATLLAAVEPYLAYMPSRAARWSEEMLETAAFVETLGLPRGLYEGAAGFYELISETRALHDARADPTRMSATVLAAAIVDELLSAPDSTSGIAD
jgi:3-hydroxyisobutyrate dehydrogenase-like beta-hydroxyacid dehydrogenase